MTELHIVNVDGFNVDDTVKTPDGDVGRIEEFRKIAFTNYTEAKVCWNPGTWPYVRCQWFPTNKLTRVE